MDAHRIEQSCRDTRDATAQGLRWIADPKNSSMVYQDRPRIERVLRRTAAEAERLERTLQRPTCVGVFGPSQAGKSYLVSVLARKEGQETMMAKFAGKVPEVDFIKSINPLGGEEATGLVTRFTMQEQPAPDGFPVCLRLLSQSDILKILINSYFQDGDQEYERPLDPTELDEHVRSYESKARPQPLDALREEDMWDLQDYLARNSGGASTALAVEKVWDRLARLTPRLPVAERGGLLSVLWGRHKTYTLIFDELTGALARLGFPSDLFCPLESLMPSKDSILNVKTLEGLLRKANGMLPVSTLNGPPQQLPRAIVTALASELRIVCRDQPHDFFAATDLLDFPGYRSRTTHDLTKYLRDAPDTAPKELFLRGKVDYLFQSYTANLELTSMVLCLPDSNLEVTSLPKAVENWISVTHGATPEQRAGKPTLLFFALTKFDRHLMESAGEEGNAPALRFEIRLNASLLQPFAKVEPSWPRQWTPEIPFNNLFWIRNPNFKAEHVIVYQDRQEVAVIPERIERIKQLRAAFIESALVRKHFRDPARAWDEVMKLNDGGIGYLSRALGVVSTQDLKLRQVGARLTEIRRLASESLRPYYVEDDYAKRRAERLAVMDDKVFVDLNGAAEKNAFGSTLRGLMVDTSDLYASVSEALNRPQPESAQQKSRRDGPFTRREANGQGGPRADRWQRIAEATMVCWTNVMSARSEDPAFARRIAVSSASLKELSDELSTAARRINLASRIASHLRERSAPNENPDASARKASLIAERLINRFVSELDFEGKSETAQRAEFSDELPAPVFLAKEVQFDTSRLAEERKDFATDYMEDWGNGFRATVAVNAARPDASGRDPQQNALLGEILRAMAA